jgi:hypothetical protein
MREVIIEDIPAEIRVGSNGVLIRIREDGRSVGKLWIGKAKVRWGRGNVPFETAKAASMDAFIAYLDSL